MIHLLAQDVLESIRDRFEKGGSPYTPLVAVLGILGLAGVLLILQRLQQRSVSKPPLNDPALLFSAVLERAGLNVMQRHLLRRVAADLRLPHPTVMLLSPELFLDHVKRWRRMLEERGSGTSASTELLHEVAETLFGPQAAKPMQKPRSARVAES